MHDTCSQYGTKWLLQVGYTTFLNTGSSAVGNGFCYEELYKF